MNVTNETVLEARGLSRRFAGQEGQIVVLDGVDLAVSRGEVVGIVGASGVGKSTLLHVLGSLDRPDQGDVFVAGRDVSTLNARELNRLRNQTLGFVFQFHFLLPEFTALENVMMPRLLSGASPGEAERLSRSWLEKVGLADRETHRPSELSGGEQQRVAVARALANDPEVVLADEPTGNLDDRTGEGIHLLIRTLAEAEHKTFVVVTHKRGFSRFADRILVLTNGKLVPDGDI